MTHAELKQLCIKLLDNNELYVRHAGVVQALEKIAENAFVDELDSADHDIVREQLKYLRKHGCLNVS